MGHRTARDVFIFRRLTRFMMFAGFRLAAETAGNGSGEIMFHPHVRIPLLVRRQRDDCETVARPAPRQEAWERRCRGLPAAFSKPDQWGRRIARSQSGSATRRGAGLHPTTNTALDARTRPLTPAEPAAPTAPPPLRQPLRAQPTPPYLRRAPGPPPAAANDGTTR